MEKIQKSKLQEKSKSQKNTTKKNFEKNSAFSQILKLLQKNYPDAKCALFYSNPLELLIATQLSAQCTDERVNKVTPILFAKYKNAEDYAKASLQNIETIIRSCGFYHNKAKNIQGSCKMIVEKFDGQVPKTMDELLTLPGVARKTANVVLFNAFGAQEGITVDTHVSRLSHRLHLSYEKTPEKIEKDLMKITPQKYWGILSHYLILHGRKICKAQKPICQNCFLSSLCPSAFLSDAKGKWIGPK